jgi:hypothetical protein
VERRRDHGGLLAWVEGEGGSRGEIGRARALAAEE